MKNIILIGLLFLSIGSYAQIATWQAPEGFALII